MKHWLLILLGLLLVAGAVAVAVLIILGITSQSRAGWSSRYPPSEPWRVTPCGWKGTNI